MAASTLTHIEPADVGIDQQVSLVAAMLATGQPEKALRCCHHLIDRYPDHEHIRHLTAVALLQNGRARSAIPILQDLVADGHADAAIYNHLGLALLEDRRPLSAAGCFEKALQSNSNMAPAANNLGLAHSADGQTRKAIHSFQQALRIAPDYPEAHYNLGRELLYADQQQAARKCFEKAISLRPDYTKAKLALGDLLRQAGRLSEAITIYQSGLESADRHVGLLNGLANALAADHRLEEAEKTFDRILALAPHEPVSLCHLANLYRRQHRFDEAITVYRKAISLRPDFAEAHFNLSLVLLLTEQFEEGWKEYHWRWHQPDGLEGYPHRHGLPLWDGQPLNGKAILVYDEQGFGDVFMLLRYLGQVKQTGAVVVFEVRSALARVCRHLAAVDELVVRESGRLPETACDVCIPLASLPGLFDTTTDSIPAPVPYLEPDAYKTAKWRQRLKTGRRSIGLVWSGSSVDPFRACPIEHFRPLADHPGVQFYSLQKKGTDMAPLPDWIIDLDEELTDFEDTAAVIANLDLVISVDTAVAHLAGALNAPAWVLLPHVPDWRWFLGRSDSPWYPSVRLFRQSRPGDWSSCFRSLSQAWGKWVQTSGRISDNEKEIPDLHQKGLPNRPHRLALEAFQQGVRFQDTDAHRAISAYEQAVKADPDFYEACYNLAVLYHRQHNWQLAVFNYRRVLKLNPQWTQARFNLALLYHETGQVAEAIAVYRDLLQLEPRHADAAYNLGLMYLELKRFSESAAFLKLAVALAPDNYRVHNNLGIACQQMGDFKQAQICFQKAIDLRPEAVSAYHNMGNLFLDLNQPHATLDWYKKALDRQPDDAAAYAGVGKLCLDLLDPVQARPYLKKAIAYRPNDVDYHMNMATACLWLGDWDAGWRHYEWRLQSPMARIRIYPYELGIPEWQGQYSPDESLLIYCEQGLGDTIQFSRFIPEARKRVGRVLFEVPIDLVPLFKGFPGIDELVVRPEDSPGQYDVSWQVGLMSLAHRLGIRPAHLPGPMPYLKPSLPMAKKWRRFRDKNRFNIGIVWAGSVTHPMTDRRNCRPEDFLALHQLPGTRLFAMQKSGDVEARRQFCQKHDIVDLGQHLSDFGDTAGAMTVIDLLVTVDTAVAHLAGAMGRPVWTLVPHRPDWRWPPHRDVSDWYPSMRLYRQSTKGDWSVEFDKICKDLKPVIEKGGFS